MTLPKAVLFISASEESTALFCEAVGIIDPAIFRMTAASTEEAIQFLSGDAAPPPHIVFFDTRSQLNSTTSITKLRLLENLKGSAVAVFSSLLSLDNQKSFAAAGVDFYLLKPKTLLHMVNVLQHVFTRHKDRIEKRQTNHQLVA